MFPARAHMGARTHQPLKVFGCPWLLGAMAGQGLGCPEGDAEGMLILV